MSNGIDFSVFSRVQVSPLATMHYALSVCLGQRHLDVGEEKSTGISKSLPSLSTRTIKVDRKSPAPRGSSLFVNLWSSYDISLSSQYPYFLCGSQKSSASQSFSLSVSLRGTSATSWSHSHISPSCVCHKPITDTSRFLSSQLRSLPIAESSASSRPIEPEELIVKPRNRASRSSPAWSRLRYGTLLTISVHSSKVIRVSGGYKAGRVHYGSYRRII